MKKVETRGIILPIITPMNGDETTNKEELGNRANRQIDGGVHGLFPFGTNGEGYILSEVEKEQVLNIVIDETKGRVPIYTGTGCISTRDTIRQSGTTKSLDADVLSAVIPSSTAVPQDELHKHYKAMAGAVGMPIVLYSVPTRTGNSLASVTVTRLSKTGNIVGAKDSSGNFDNMLQYIEQTRGSSDFAIPSGNNSLVLQNLLAGGIGGIAGRANIPPEVMVSIYDFLVAGDLEGARRAQDSVRSFRVCFKYGNPNIVVRVIIVLLGYPVGKYRAPFNQVSGEGVETLKKVLAESHEKGVC